jgi:hypothetical protein
MARAHAAHLIAGDPGAAAALMRPANEDVLVSGP